MYNASFKQMSNNDIFKMKKFKNVAARTNTHIRRPGTAVPKVKVGAPIEL